jgi:hypothetical protein
MRLASTISVMLVTLAVLSVPANAATVTDPNDPRVWQGATVGTFAQLIHGSNTLANRTLITSAGLLDDSFFSPVGYLTGSLVATPWAMGTGGSPNHNGGNSRGYSHDLTGVGGYAYTATNGISLMTAANTIDNQWFQSSNTVGDTVFDLGFQATKAAVFNTIDHGPLPHEAIESTVYLSNDQATWTQAVVQKVWLEGFQSILGIQWDGFVYAVGTAGGGTFRYASVIHGGPGALINDGDDEINGVMGLQANFAPTASGVPLPSAVWAGVGLLGMMGAVRRLRRRN